MSFLNAKSQKESTRVLFFYLRKPLKHFLQLVQKKITTVVDSIHHGG